VFERERERERERAREASASASACACVRVRTCWMRCFGTYHILLLWLFCTDAIPLGSLTTGLFLCLNEDNIFETPLKNTIV
jgi:hypothetical protein